MSAFFMSSPGPDRPEQEHAAYRLAVKCWQGEQEGRLLGTADLGDREDATLNAVELYVDAIRQTEAAREHAA